MSYDQEEKIKCRKELIEGAVKALTIERETSTCVHRDHCRKTFQELHRSQPGSEENPFTEQEITEIEKNIQNWELLHDSQVGARKPSELRVCYLAGDNPLNDFNAFVDNGVLPQNIWAIEKDAKTLKKALDSNKEAQKMPKVFKGNLLDFLRDFEGQFDIIYFDACGSLPSVKQETLKVIGYVFLCNKLTSPGALITTFSFPPKQTEAASNASPQDTERQHLNELAREYLKQRFVNTSSRSDVTNKIPFFNEEFLNSRTDEENYSEYIVYQIIDTAYMYIPALGMLTSKRNSLLEQSFVKKGTLKKAIEELLPQVITEEGRESASKMLNELRELESRIKEVLDLQMEIKGRKEQKEVQIQSEGIKYDMMNRIIHFSRVLAQSTIELETSLQREIEESEQQLMLQQQKVLEKLNEEQFRAEQLLQETQSKLDEMEEEKQRSIQDLSNHEAHPPRNISQFGHNLQSKTAGNPLCKTWASEVFPDWKSDLKEWEMPSLLMTHLLTNWIALIDKCSNKDFKDCQERIIQSLGGDGEDANRWRMIFSQFVDIPDEDVTTQMIATLLYGQMACPSFPVLGKLKTLNYTGKTRQMFSNLFIFDRCQCVYDQFPSVLTSNSVAKPHIQIVCRMAVDGLRKHLRHICEEDVFKGCTVVGRGMDERAAVIPEPSEITAQSHDGVQNNKDSSLDFAAQSHGDLDHHRDSSSEIILRSLQDVALTMDRDPANILLAYGKILHLYVEVLSMTMDQDRANILHSYGNILYVFGQDLAMTMDQDRANILFGYGKILYVFGQDLATTMDQDRANILFGYGKILYVFGQDLATTMNQHRANMLHNYGNILRAYGKILHGFGQDLAMTMDQRRTNILHSYGNMLHSFGNTLHSYGNTYTLHSFGNVFYRDLAVTTNRDHAIVLQDYGTILHAFGQDLAMNRLTPAGYCHYPVRRYWNDPERPWHYPARYCHDPWRCPWH